MPCGSCRRRWLGFRSGLTPRSLPPLPARDVRPGHRAGPRHRAAAQRARARPGQPRLPLLRSPRLRQDHVGPHPRPQPQLRAGARRRPVRRVRQLRRAGHRGQRLHRRDRDRRRVARRCRRRPRPAREGVLRAGPRPLQDLHHRRGAHGDHGRVQRPAQAGRGAAAAPALHLRHHRAREGAADDPVAHPPLPVPADPAADAGRLPRRAVHQGGRRRSSRRPCRSSYAPGPGRRATRCRCSTS